MADESILSQASKNLLQSVRNLFGVDNVRVTSTGRTKAQNDLVSGSNTSDHLITADGANAFDYTVKGYTPQQVASIIQNSGLKFGQNIAEYVNGFPHNHLSAGNSMQTFGMNNHKTSPSLTSGITALKSAAELFLNPLGWGRPAGYNRQLLKNATGDTIGNAASDAAVKAGDAVKIDWNDWFMRVSIAIVAILLIAVALFMLVRSNNITITPAALKSA